MTVVIFAEPKLNKHLWYVIQQKITRYLYTPHYFDPNLVIKVPHCEHFTSSSLINRHKLLILNKLNRVVKN